MPNIWSKSSIWVSDFSGGQCLNTTLNTARLKQMLALILGQAAATWCKFFCMTASHQSHTQLLRTVSTLKQSMTLLVAGQFVGNSMPPRVVPCATANSPMFAALAFKPHCDQTHKSQRTPSSMPDAATAAKKRRLSTTLHDQSPPLLKHLAAWEHCLADDFDRDFILHCVKYGASLIDPDKCQELIPPASVPNGHSVTTEAVYPLVTHQILNELANSNYIQCDTPPKIVSALSAIPKPDGNIRLIHDMSLPDDLSVNSYASKDPCKYQTIAEALALMQPSWFMVVLDLRSAYRSVHISDNEHCLTGLSWKFPGDSTPTFMFDSWLPFGSWKSPQYSTDLYRQWLESWDVKVTILWYTWMISGCVVPISKIARQLWMTLSHSSALWASKSIGRK